MRGSFREDICGDVESPPPPAGMLPLRRAMAAERLEGLTGFRDAVKAGIFPHELHQVPMRAGEHQGDFTLHRQEKLRCSGTPQVGLAQRNPTNSASAARQSVCRMSDHAAPVRPTRNDVPSEP